MTLNKTSRKFSLYKPDLVARARDLRKNATLGERLLWSKLLGHQLLGYSFIRQAPIHNYIVDFLCKELQLIIEIDGFTHDYKIDYDKIRQRFLEQEGYTILRFQEQEVRVDLQNVVQRLVGWIEPRIISHPPTRERRPPQGGSMRPLPRKK